MKNLLALIFVLGTFSAFADESNNLEKGIICTAEYTDKSSLTLKVSEDGSYNLSFASKHKKLKSFSSSGNLDLPLVDSVRSNSKKLFISHNKETWNGDRGGDVSFVFLSASSIDENNTDLFAGHLRFLSYRMGLGKGALLICSPN